MSSRFQPSLSFAVKAFLAFLPWSVLVSVFLGHKIGIPGASLLKEAFLFSLAAAVVGKYAARRAWPTFDLLDFAVFAYVGWMLLATAVSGGSFAHFAYGGRYDFEFLFALLAFKHARPFLEGAISSYVLVFLKSATAAIVLGMLVRFGFGEEILLHFGFSPNLSNWQFGGSVPIYHGIDQANVRRFQGIFDGPNPAAFFIITYAGLLLHYFRTRKDDAFPVAIWAAVLFLLLLYTYSRSSLVGVALACGLTFLLSLRVIWTKYRKAFLWSIPLLAAVVGMFYLRFETTIDRIILREGSSKGHFERMVIGLERFRENPVFGEGLAASGPAYRYVTPELTSGKLSESEKKAIEDRSIPESWYVQQLVEGGFPAFVLFLGILGIAAVRLYAFSAAFFTAFVAACSMNLFLHTFESAYASVALFAFVGLFLAPTPKAPAPVGRTASERIR